MKYNIEILKQLIDNKPDTPIIYFWGHTPSSKEINMSCLSQWYDCWFEVNGIIYHTAEQFMMAEKARIFGDEETRNKIMDSNNPFDHKKLGRTVKGFVGEIWDAQKFDIIVKGNKAKFSQNQPLAEYLLSTGNAILAEASPYDRIWGIGLDREDAKLGTVSDWQGENLLGCALMCVRDWLKNND